MPSNITFTFEEGVPSSERERIQVAILQARQIIGDAGPTSVYAYVNLEALLSEDVRTRNDSATSQDSMLIRQRFENHQWRAMASSDRIYILVNQDWLSFQDQVASSALAHEYFHLFQEYRAKRALEDVGPLWLTEGAAEYAASRVTARFGLIDPQQLHAEKTAYSRGLLNPLIRAEEEEDATAPYTLGYLAAEYLASSFGEPAILRKFWDAQASGATWQAAFASTFGMSIDDFYSRFELYRKTRFPPWCGNVGDEPSGAFAIRFDRQHPPGSLKFAASPFTYDWPLPVPYTFCVTGFAVTTLTSDQLDEAFKRPEENLGWGYCGGNCLILYMDPFAAPGRYSVSVVLPDGRRAETTFQHVSNPATATPEP